MSAGFVKPQRTHPTVEIRVIRKRMLIKSTPTVADAENDFL